jgi:integrase
MRYGRDEDLPQLDEGEVQATLRELAADPPVEFPQRKELVRVGRASLAGITVDPDTVVPPEVDAMLVEGIPVNTRETYEYQWGRFVLWCSQTGRGHLPATTETVRFYIWSHWSMTDRAGKLRGRRGRPYAPTTVELAVYTVSIVHQWLGHASPTRHPKVRTQLRGYRNRWGAQGHKPDKADMITSAESVAVARACDLGTVNGLRNAAMFRLQFDMGSRASEIVALNVDDLRWLDERRVAVHIRRSKTDQDARGRVNVVEMVDGPDVDVDPARLLAAQVAVLRAAGRTDGPLFPELGAGAPRRLDSPDVARSVLPGRLAPDGYERAWVKAARRAGIDRDPVTGVERRITSHSNRSGLITEAGRAGMPREEVAARTGHSIGSPTFHGYFDTGGTQLGDRNAGTLLRQRTADAADQAVVQG